MKQALIFDRTASDVSLAKSLANERKKQFADFTEEEKKTIERGFFLLSTINRIEDSEEMLFGFIRDLAYYGDSIETKRWDYADIFRESDFSRVIKNAKVLRDTFFSYSTTPSDVAVRYDFQSLNNLEKILYDLFSIVDFLEENSKECDTFYCGED